MTDFVVIYVVFDLILCLNVVQINRWKSILFSQQNLPQLYLNVRIIYRKVKKVLPCSSNVSKKNSKQSNKSRIFRSSLHVILIVSHHVFVWRTKRIELESRNCWPRIWKRERHTIFVKIDSEKILNGVAYHVVLYRSDFAAHVLIVNCNCSLFWP